MNSRFVWLNSKLQIPCTEIDEDCDEFADFLELEEDVAVGGSNIVGISNAYCEKHKNKRTL